MKIGFAGEFRKSSGNGTGIRKHFFLGAKYLQRKGSVWGGVMDSGRVVWDDRMVGGSHA